MSEGIVEPIVALYEQVRQYAEAYLKKAGYRVTKIKAYILEMEYLPTDKAYGELDPPAFLLAHVDVSFKVTAMKLPVRYQPDEVELTIDLFDGKLFVRREVYTHRSGHGWLVLEV